MKELDVASDALNNITVCKRVRSPVPAMIKFGAAVAQSPSGDPAPKRAVVRPLVEDKLFDWSPLPVDAICRASYG